MGIYFANSRARLRLWSAAALVGSFAFAGVASAAAQPGDILLDQFNAPSLQLYSPTGTLRQTYTGTGQSWEGAGVTPDGSTYITTRRSSSGLNLYNAVTGAEVTFDTPEVAIPGDVSVFADGMIAVSDQTGPTSVELYSQAGAHLASFNGVGAFGNFVNPLDNTIWTVVGGVVQHFNEAGTLLGSFNGTGANGDLVVNPADGSLFITDRNTGVVHYTAGGTLLGSFTTAASATSGIGMAADGTLYIDGENSASIYHYSQSGTLLDSFPIDSPAVPLFLTIVPVPEPTTAAGLGLLAIAGAGVIRRQRRR